MVATLALLGIALLIVWYVLFGQLDAVAAEAVKAGRIKERMTHRQSPEIERQTLF